MSRYLNILSHVLVPIVIIGIHSRNSRWKHIQYLSWELQIWIKPGNHNLHIVTRSIGTLNQQPIISRNLFAYSEKFYRNLFACREILVVFMQNSRVHIHRVTCVQRNKPDIPELFYCLHLAKNQKQILALKFWNKSC